MTKKIKINKPGNSKLWFIIPDVHFPEQDQEAVEVMLAAHRELNPDYTLLLGDVLDCGLFSMHPKRYFIENSAYDFHQLEINPANTMIDQLQKNTKLHTYFLEGNHECVREDTEILTEHGWKLASGISSTDKVASFGLNSKEISFAYPEVLSKYTAPIYSVKGDLSSERVSSDHKIIVKSKLQKVSEIDFKIPNSDMIFAGYKKSETLALSDDMLKILTWTIMDGTLVRRKLTNNIRIQFKLSKPRKIERLTSILTNAGISFTFRKATKSGINVLQPYYICIYGDKAREIYHALEGNKQLPKNWESLNRQQLNIVLEEIRNTDGSLDNQNGASYLSWTSTDKNNVDIIQLACIYNNIPCIYNTNITKSGFSNAKVQYKVNIYNKKISNRRKTVVKEEGYNANVVAIQTENGTLITRFEGKISFTGNSRIERWSVANGRIGESIYDLISPRSTIAKHRENFTMIPYSPPTGDRRGFVQISKATNKRSGLVGVHGWSVAKHAASAHLEKSRSQSVIHGHTHRQQLETSRDPWTGQIIKAFCPGTLSKLQPIYMVGGAPSSWSHGVCIVYVGNESWTEYLISIVNGRCVLPTGKEIRLV